MNDLMNENLDDSSQRFTTSRREGMLETFFTGALILLSLCFLVLWALVAFLRISYPYELEWMEGGLLAHVQRVLDGNPLYVAPSAEFTPFIYTPFYYYLAAGLSLITGDGFMGMRLISIISSTGILALIFLFVRRESASSFYGLISAGLFAACYAASGYWFDIARSDMMFLFLFLAGLYLLRSDSGVKGDLLASIFLILAFFTKQTALMPTLPLILYTLAFGKGWRRLVFPFSYALVVTAGCLIANTMTHGWFAFYVFKLPKSHPIFYSKIVTFWIFDLAPILFLPLLTAGWIILSGFFKKQFKDSFFWFMLFGGLVGAAWFSRIHSGGWINVLTPAFLGLSLFWGVGMKQWSDLMPECRGRLALYGLMLIQFSLLLYNPIEALPTEEDRIAGDQFVEDLKKHEHVFIPHHPYLATMAGFPPQGHQMALVDVIRAEVPEAEELRRQLAEALSELYDAVYLSEPWLMDQIPDSHLEAPSPFTGRDVFVPVTGVPLRPDLVYFKSSGSAE